jgi:hypothetical protein
MLWQWQHLIILVIFEWTFKKKNKKEQGVLCISSRPESCLCEVTVNFWSFTSYDLQNYEKNSWSSISLRTKLQLIGLNPNFVRQSWVAGLWLGQVNTRSLLELYLIEIWHFAVWCIYSIISRPWHSVFSKD